MIKILQSNRSRVVALALVASASAIGAVADFEGFSDTAYRDIGGIWTIGYGETSGVTKGMTISKTEATQLLTRSIRKHETGIKKCINNIPLYQYEYDAYTSLAYNIGVTNFCKSSIVKNLKQGNYEKACDSIGLWNKVRVKGKLTYSRGLDNRRKKEILMCKGKL